MLLNRAKCLKYKKILIIKEMRLFKKALSFEFATRTEWQKKNVFLACLKQCSLAKKINKFGNNHLDTETSFEKHKRQKIP